MKLAIDVSLTYALGAQRTALLALEAARTAGQTVLEDRLEIEGAELSQIEGEWGIGHRNWVRIDGDALRLLYTAVVDVAREAVNLEGLAASPLHDLTEQQIPFLRPSRYCQSDQFESFVADQFGHRTDGARIAAILDWIDSVMEYGPDHSHSETTLLDTFSTRKGVCRDYVHLFCGLARASHIPARYVSAYGVNVDPPDFHAVAQVWLDETWHMVDPTGMCTANELALIAVGRDAGDVPFMETPDEARFVEQQVRVTAV